MAILLRFNFFIARKSSIAVKYPGGLEQFRADWMSSHSSNESLGEDDHLVGFCSMGRHFDEVLEKLFGCGLENWRGNGVIDIAFGDELSGIEAGCDWLEVGDWVRGTGGAFEVRTSCDWFEFREGKRHLKCCWLTGTMPGEVVKPMGR